MITCSYDLARGRIFFRNATFAWVLNVVPINGDLQTLAIQTLELQMRDFSEVVMGGAEVFFLQVRDLSRGR